MGESPWLLKGRSDEAEVVDLSRSGCKGGIALRAVMLGSHESQVWLQRTLQGVAGAVIGLNGY